METHYYGLHGKTKTTICDRLLYLQPAGGMSHASNKKYAWEGKQDHAWLTRSGLEEVAWIEKRPFAIRELAVSPNACTTNTYNPSSSTQYAVIYNPPRETTVYIRLTLRVILRIDLPKYLVSCRLRTFVSLSLLWLLAYLILTRLSCPVRHKS